MTALKSFAMLVGQGEGAHPGNRVVGASGDPRQAGTGPVIGKARCSPGSQIHRPLEARYSYYRRCQQLRRNGEQCKAPAMKGEAICHRHAEQLDTERRRAEQRREILSRPGAGLGSFRAIQRTIVELAGAILAGSIDHKAAGRLIVDIQTAIRLQKMLTTQTRRRGKIFLARSLNTGAESPIDQRGRAFAAINGRSSTGHHVGPSIGGGDAPPTREQAA
jgi:hypothetical protein